MIDSIVIAAEDKNGYHLNKNYDWMGDYMIWSNKVTSDILYHIKFVNYPGTIVQFLDIFPLVSFKYFGSQYFGHFLKDILPKVWSK